MKAFFGSSLIALTVTNAVDLPDLKEWDFLERLNSLRAEGMTCPNGEVFEPNPVPLEWDCRLFDAAKGHSQDMADNSYFSHYNNESENPTDRYRAAGGQTAGVWENIAGGNSQGSMTFDQWVVSESGHCNNMMHPDRKSVAVGYGKNLEDRYVHYWTMKLTNLLPRESDKDCLLTPAPTPPPVPSIAPTANPTFRNGLVMDPEVKYVWDWINYRREDGHTCPYSDVTHPSMHKLMWNCALERAAQQHSDDMALNEFVRPTGSDGSSSGDRAEQHGVHFRCSQFQIKTTYGRNAYASFNQLSCQHFLGNEEYKSMAVARKYNANLDTYYWTLMLSEYETEPEHRDCWSDEMWEDYYNGTPEPTSIPTYQPTDPSTTPTVAPSPAPTSLPTKSPTKVPTTAPTFFDCAALLENKACKKNNECSWKKDSCKAKRDICPGMSGRNCGKYECNYVDGVCSWGVALC